MTEPVAVDVRRRGHGAATIAVLLLLLGAASGSWIRCGWPHGFVEAPVESAQLAGVWKATPATEIALREAGFTDHLEATHHLLELKPGGRCRCRTFLHYNDPDSAGNRFVDVTDGCTWEVERVRWLNRDLKWAVSFELRLPDNEIARNAFFIAREEGRLVLWHIVGDPDNGETLAFVRAPD